MPTPKATSLCQFILANGKPCGQVALKIEPLCRHHRRLFKQSESEMIHDEAMDRLAAELRSLPFPALLRTLHAKLNRIHHVVCAHHEAQLALDVTLEQLRQIMPEISPRSPANSSENSAESITPRTGRSEHSSASMTYIEWPFLKAEPLQSSTSRGE